MVPGTASMRPRNAAILMLALATASGCAGMSPRWLKSGLGTPVDVPKDAIPMGQFVRGEIALQRNDIDTAVSAFEKAVEADPDTPMLRLRLATLYVRTGRLDLARAQCAKVVESQPDNL